ncbi:hypothetical protein PCC7418_0197 [Halothece sp. PCC 7418]|uniref:Nif11-like leader peptide family natural product precursor n=1 Tax=Halothece sp. (strain PCC 7418) TaxID=65093 RepID=UPI0002A06149|nr:Nif11-like leader peptide family natural product precursor [Halothece sp. PCC 7418]AFZ42435.1 hypothetical protein PCC7418_0197 [Halothece sp. PCC 7418]
MSDRPVKKFLDKLNFDSALQEEATKALETTTSTEEQAIAMTELAASKGYEFTKEELRVEVENRQLEREKRKANGELSDQELEAVAGGFYYPSKESAYCY